MSPVNAVNCAPWYFPVNNEITSITGYGIILPFLFTDINLPLLYKTKKSKSCSISAIKALTDILKKPEFINEVKELAQVKLGQKLKDIDDEVNSN